MYVQSEFQKKMMPGFSNIADRGSIWSFHNDKSFRGSMIENRKIEEEEKWKCKKCSNKWDVGACGTVMEWDNY